MNATFHRVELPLSTPFSIARGTTETAENVVVEIEADGETGYGAAAPSPRYGETIDTVEAVLPDLLAAAESVGDPHARRRIQTEMQATVRDNPAARAAVDIALWDLAGSLLETPLYRLLGLVPGGPETSYTIGLGPTDEMKRRAEAATDAGHSILKLKLGTDRDLEIVAAVRAAAPEATIRVDANEAWDRAEAIRKIETLEGYGVEFVEQPVPADGDLAAVYEAAPLPIVLDESVEDAASVSAVADICDGVNFKLVKCGGLTPTLDAIATARAHGLSVMCGCMIETDAAIAAAAHLLPLLDYADLDGSLLLSEDPYDGVPVTGGRFDLAAVDSGTGVTPR
ncbi:MAG: dipeptide epimerase [Natronomonas sp.]